jgi:hypothetical protein
MPADLPVAVIAHLPIPQRQAVCNVLCRVVMSHHQPRQHISVWAAVRPHGTHRLRLCTSLSQVIHLACSRVKFDRADNNVSQESSKARTICHSIQCMLCLTRQPAAFHLELGTAADSSKEELLVGSRTDT